MSTMSALAVSMSGTNAAARRDGRCAADGEPAVDRPSRRDRRVDRRLGRRRGDLRGSDLSRSDAPLPTLFHLRGRVGPRRRAIGRPRFRGGDADLRQTRPSGLRRGDEGRERDGQVDDRHPRPIRAPNRAGFVCIAFVVEAREQVLRARRPAPGDGFVHHVDRMADTCRSDTPSASPTPARVIRPSSPAPSPACLQPIH